MTHRMRPDSEFNLDWSFMKNEQLFGRFAEIENLNAAFHRCLSDTSQPELILLSGKSGTGKTVLARKLKQPVISRNGYFVQGKFDQLRKPQPYAAFVSAFTELIQIILSRGPRHVGKVRRVLFEALQSDSQLLVRMIPALENIIGAQQSRNISALGQEIDARMKVAVGRFVRAICSRENPLVLVMDDLQWADTGSLDLLESLVSDDKIEGLVFVGVCRSNEVSFDHGFAALLRKLEDEQGQTITHIIIGELSCDAVNDMVSHVLQLPQEKCQPLTDILVTKTGGNAFFVMQLIQVLHSEQVLCRDPKLDHWIWDEQKLSNLDLEKDVVNMISRRIKKLPVDAQTVIMSAACLGAEFNLNLLLSALANIDVSKCLEIATMEGLIIHDSKSDRYIFSHDKIQQAAYASISEEEKPLVHLSMGKKLWKVMTPQNSSKYIFLVVDQMIRGVSQIQNQSEKDELAILCLKAGKEAIVSSDFRAAAIHFWMGIDLLGRRHWRDQYDLSLELYNAAAEAEYCIANFDKMDKAVGEVLYNARYFEDKVRVYSTQIYSLWARSQLQEAIDLGLRVLGFLGISFPPRTRKLDILVDIIKTRTMLYKKSDNTILSLPDMDEPTIIASMSLMNLLIPYTYIARQSLFPLISTRLVQLSLKHGLCAVSAFGFCAYGGALIQLGLIETGMKYSKLSLEVLNRYKETGNVWIPRIYASFYGMGAAWNQPIRSVLDPLLQGHKIGMETGDIEFSMMSTRFYCLNAFIAGVPLPEIAEKIVTFLEIGSKYKQGPTTSAALLQLQMIHNFIGKEVDDPKILTGEVIDEKVEIEKAKNNPSTAYFGQYHLWRLLLAYHFGDYDLALAMAEINKQVEFSLKTYIIISVKYLYHGLAAIAAATQKKRSSQRKQVNIAKKCVKQLGKLAKISPNNCMHKLALLKAELVALKAKKNEAEKVFEMYDEAISIAKRNQFLHEHALACERASIFATNQADDALAKKYSQEALKLYKQWGATTKIKYMLRS